MKQPKKLTRQQKEILTSHSLNANDWMLVEEMEFYLKIIHKSTGKTKMIDKFVRGKKR